MREFIMGLDSYFTDGGRIRQLPHRED